MVGAEHRDLGSIWLFSGCSKSELRTIHRVLEEVTVPSGSLLVEEGQPGVLFFIVVSGRAVVQRGDKSIAVIGPGAFFGELSLLDEEPRSASVLCETEMTLLVLRKRHFQKILTASPSTARKLLAAMSGRLRESDALGYQ